MGSDIKAPGEKEGMNPHWLAPKYTLCLLIICLGDGWRKKS